MRRFLSAVTLTATACAGLVVGVSSAGAATSITVPAANPYVVPGNVAGVPQAFDVTAAGFAPGANVYIEQCDGVSPTSLNWTPTAHCDLVTSPAAVISTAGGVATFDKADPNHAFLPFKGSSPQGQFNCLSPNDPASNNGLVDSRNCQIRVSTNNTAVTADQVFRTLQLPEDPSNPTPDPVQIGIGNAGVLEGKTGTRAATFAVTLSAAATTPVTMDYKVLEGTAKPGSDYSDKTGQLTIPAGSVSAQIAINIKGDSTVEPSEKFIVKIQHPSSNATIKRNGGTGTIINDDPPKAGIRMGIGDASVIEGKTGNRSLRFTVSLSEKATQSVSAHYATVAGSASATTDFVATSGTVTIAAGKTAATIIVKVRGDATAESNENFLVKLSGGVHASISRVNGGGTILNDD